VQGWEILEGEVRGLQEGEVRGGTFEVWGLRSWSKEKGLKGGNEEVRDWRYAWR
jgi:hypothetical protein